MYARRETFGAMYGNAYGFAKSPSNAQLDWTVDGQAFNVLYLGLNGNNGYVAPGDGGNANGYVPSTMAVWGQLESPHTLHSLGHFKRKLLCWNYRGRVMLPIRMEMVCPSL